MTSDSVICKYSPEAGRQPGLAAATTFTSSRPNTGGKATPVAKIPGFMAMTAAAGRTSPATGGSASPARSGRGLSSREGAVGEATGRLLGLSHIKRPPKYSFTGRYTREKLSSGPGPGAYDHAPMEATSRYTKSPKPAFPMSARDTRSRASTPGPGAYANKDFLGSSGKAYSLTPRRPTRPPESLEIPGPGAHDTKTSIGQGPKFSACSRRDGRSHRNVPGPGQYEQAVTPFSDRDTTQPRWGFGTSSRPQSRVCTSTTPGPGAYGCSTIVGEGPKFSIAARPASRKLDDIPGPGAHGGQWTQFE